MARGLVGGAAAVVGIGLLCLGVLYVKGRPPADIRNVVEPRLDALRTFAERTAPRCPEVRNAGLVAEIRGTTPVSPAVGTPMETWPELVDLHVDCFWWTSADHTGAGGNGFRPLRNAPSRPDGSSEGQWIIHRGLLPGAHDSTREESATWWQRDPHTLDVEIHRPLPDGSGYIVVVATLRRPAAS